MHLSILVMRVFYRSSPRFICIADILVGIIKDSIVVLGHPLLERSLVNTCGLPDDVFALGVVPPWNQSLELAIFWLEIFMTESEAQVLGLHQYDGSAEWDALSSHIHEQLVKCGFYVAVCGTPDPLSVPAANVGAETMPILRPFLIIAERADWPISNFRVISLFLMFNTLYRMVYFIFRDSTFLLAIEVLGVVRLGTADKSISSRKGVT